VRLEVPVGAIQYAVGSGRKEAHYWRASVIDSVRREPDGEVDKVAWVPARAALTRMSYGDERALLDRALGLPPATPFLVVRHAKAMERKNWSGRDDARPLNARGRKQADALVALLAAYGVGRLESSTATRCVQTLKPYAKASRLDTQGWSTLVEEFAEGHPKELAKLMKRLVGQAVGDQVPAAVCGHRPALPGMLESVGLQPRPMEPAAVAVAHLDAAGATVAAEFHKPLV
jgi:8-oxo-dGTP diphosphatase